MAARPDVLLEIVGLADDASKPRVIVATGIQSFH
jgi:hypothetical protein